MKTTKSPIIPAIDQNFNDYESRFYQLLNQDHQFDNEDQNWIFHNVNKHCELSYGDPNQCKVVTFSQPDAILQPKWLKFTYRWYQQFQYLNNYQYDDNEVGKFWEGRYQIDLEQKPLHQMWISTPCKLSGTRQWDLSFIVQLIDLRDYDDQHYWNLVSLFNQNLAKFRNQLKQLFQFQRGICFQNWINLAKLKTGANRKQQVDLNQWNKLHRQGLARFYLTIHFNHSGCYYRVEFLTWKQGYLGGSGSSFDFVIKDLAVLEKLLVIDQKQADLLNAWMQLKSSYQQLKLFCLNR